MNTISQSKILNKYNQLILQFKQNLFTSKQILNGLINSKFLTLVFKQMIYRNQPMHPSQFSTNYLLNKQRKLNYHAHLNKINQIENRQFNPKLEAKLLDKKIVQLTKLKEFSRNYKAKQEQSQRLKNDLLMIQHINERNHTKIYPQIGDSILRKTKSTFKFNSRIVSSSVSTKNLISGFIKGEQVQKENRRLIKSITQNSFDQDRFRKTIKESTKDYLKVRAHMRRVKNERQQSLKKLKTQPIEDVYERACPISLISTSNNQELQEYQVYKNLRNTEQTTSQSQKNKTLRKSTTKNKKMFKLNQSLTQIIDKKLDKKLNKNQ